MSSPSATRRFRFYLLAVAIWLSGCATSQIEHGVYVNAAKGFTVPLPAAGWHIERGRDPDLLLRHQDGDAGIMVRATCGDERVDRPVEILGRHLFFGVHAQEQRTAVHGEAVETFLRGHVGGRGLLFHGITLKGPACVYDLVLFATPDHYAAANEVFEALVLQLEFGRGGT